LGSSAVYCFLLLLWLIVVVRFRQSIPDFVFGFQCSFSDSSTSSSVSGDRSYFAARVLEVGMGWEVSWFVDGKGEQAA
jgi:hypothetical protein